MTHKFFSSINWQDVLQKKVEKAMKTNSDSPHCLKKTSDKQSSFRFVCSSSLLSSHKWPQRRTRATLMTSSQRRPSLSRLLTNVSTSVPLFTCESSRNTLKCVRKCLSVNKSVFENELSGVRKYSIIQHCCLGFDTLVSEMRLRRNITHSEP